MRELLEPGLKLVCAALATLILVQSVGVVRRMALKPGTSIPEPGTWSPPTNAAAGEGAAGGMPSGTPPGMRMPPMGPRGMGGGGGGGGLDAAAQARVDRLVQSELLGPVMRPPPMALLGIAGKDVLLRAPNGQAGLVKEGAEMGGVQILKIGTNRVLVKVDGETKELTIFEGIGGESLMPK